MWTSAEIQIHFENGPFVIEYKFVKVKEDNVSPILYNYIMRQRSLLIPILYNFQSDNKETWEKRFNRQLDLSKYIVSDKVAHITIEDAGFDKTMPNTKVQRLYDSKHDLREMSSITSVINNEYERMMCAEVDQDGQSMDMNLTIESYLNAAKNQQMK